MKKNFLLGFGLFIAGILSTQAQTVGGRQNSDMTPKTVGPEKLSAGTFSGDVNLFTGDYNATQSLGTVSTPSGLSYTLNYSYSAAYTTSGTSPVASGIPYGDGWSLNIPTISVETDVFNNFLQDAYCIENGSYQNPAQIHFDDPGISASKEGDLYWFSPAIDIPGVVSGRAVFKYYDVTDHAAVFALNAFSSPAEIRYYGDHWTVIVADGTRYNFYTTMMSSRAPVNARTLFYDQTDIAGADVNEVLEQDVQSDLKTSVQNAIMPKESYTSWYCDIISHNNYASQTISFTYEKYGAFNYFKEFTQPQFIFGMGEFNEQVEVDVPANYDFTAYTDILLTKISSFAPDIPVEELRLTYETDFGVLASSQQFIDYRQNGSSRFDALYSMKVLSSVKGEEEFTNWKRYNHVKKNITTGDEIVGNNPYQSGSGYRRDNVAADEKISFYHGFLESQRFGQNQLFPGDIYEIRTKIKQEQDLNENDNNSVSKRNSTFDIAVVTGKNESSPYNPTGTAFSSLNTNGTYYSATNYNSTRGVELYSTFNMAVKWHMGYRESIKETSNFFVMPNTPEAYQGINIQIGAGNSDNDFDANPEDFAYSDLSAGTHANAKVTYAHRLQHTVFGLKSAANIQHNFGIGLPWGIVIPLYERMSASSPDDVVDNVLEESSFHFWWAKPNSTYMQQHRPTKVDDKVYLDEFELIRYAKNPLMLQKVELYRLNGEAGIGNDTGWKLISSKALEYKTEETDVVENFEYYLGDPLVFKPLKKQIHILLKVIRDIPVDYDGDTLKTNPVFLEYALFNPRLTSNFEYNGIYLNAQKFLLTGLQDHLGGITRIVYYRINDPQTVLTMRYNNPKKCPSAGRDDFGTYQAMTIHPVVHYIYKNDENNLALSPAVIDLPNLKRWEYVFDVSDLRGISTDFKLINDNFRSRYTMQFKLGFGKVIVKSPSLTGGEYTYSVYEHYTHDDATLTLENHLLFGKLKSQRTYDHLDRIHEEKLYNYSYTLAFQNAYIRPNLYRSQLNYDEKDYNRVQHPYEYKDYYLNERPQQYDIINHPNDPTEYVLLHEGIAAYPSLDMPLIKGTSGLFESPRFLEFEFFPQLALTNPPYMFDSYFVKLSEEIDRVYEDYTYKESTVTNPAGIGVPVGDNPAGPGKTNAATLPNDPTYLGYISSNTNNLTNKLINGSPLSETVLMKVLETTRLTFDQKAKVLKAQNGLTNDMWGNVLHLERNFSPHQLMSLVDVQPYFSDQTLKNMLILNHADFDRKVFEAMMTKNTRLSNNVMIAMMPSSKTAIYMNNKSFMEIFTRQQHLTEELLVNVVKHPYLIPSLLPELLIGENVTPEVYKEMVKNPLIDDKEIAIIIEQDPVYPEADILLLILNRSVSPRFDVIKRIVASADRPLEAAVVDRIRLIDFSPGQQDEITNLLLNSNPLDRFCPNPEITSRNYIETKTEFEYYEADYQGISDGRAYKTLLAINNIPGRTLNMMDFFSTPGTRTVNHLYIKHEPSWQLFSKKVSSPHMPGMQSEEQYFYAYDLKNRYDRHWFNYDLEGTNRKADVIHWNEESTVPWISLVDTLGFSMEWKEDYTYNSAGKIPRFDAMVYAQQYDMRTLPFQQTNFSKKPGDGSPVMKSEYFHYEARWDVDATPDYNYNIVTDLPVDCEEEEEEEQDPPTPCETCIYEKFVNDETVARSLLPDNYCLWEGNNFFGYYMCPSSFTTNPCVPSATKVMCHPIDPNEEDEPSQYIKLSTLLNKSLQLRSSYMQVDDIASPTQGHFERYQLDNFNNYVADFWIDEINENDVNALPDYVMLLPFDNLMTTKVLDRNRYLQPELVENQAGIQTKYDYEKPEMRRYVDDECPGPESNQHRTYVRNIGQPTRVTVGYGRTDAMSTDYQYSDQGLVASVAQPSGHVMNYSYDGFLRLKEVLENGNRLLSRTGYSYWNHNFSLNFQQRRNQNFVASILYNNYVNDGVIVDTNQREVMRAYIDPLGREHSVTRNYNDRFLYSGSLVFDNWNRVTQNYKPTAETRTDGLLQVHNDLTTAFASSLHENSPKNRLVRVADYDVALSDQNTSKCEYKFVNYIFISCELNLSTEELQLLMNTTNKSAFRFFRTRKLDQDDKELIEYSNAFGQKIASLAYDDNAQKVVTLFAYDSYGNLAQVINPEKQVSTYQYNMLGLLVKESTRDNGEKRYMYNKHLKVSAIQDALHRGNHIPGVGGSHFRPLVRKFQYDDYGRLVKQYVRNVSPVYDIYVYTNKLIGDAQGNPAYVGDVQVYFDYRYSNKSSLDWLYMYRFWNGDDIVWNGPGAALIPTGNEPSAIEIPNGDDHDPDGGGPEENAPIAEDDQASGPAGTLIPVDVLANDIDPDGDFLNNNSIDLDVSHAGIQHHFTNDQGTWTANENGIVYFISELEFAGAATIQYKVNDIHGNTSGAATITVTVLNPDGVNLTEKTWTYGIVSTLPTVGKLLSTTSYSNTGLPIQQIDYGYNAEDRVSFQNMHFHPTNIGSTETGHINSRISYPDYNYRGSLLEEKIDVNRDNIVDLHYFYTYDALNRLTEVYAAKANVSSKSEATLMASYSYDDATGLLKTEKQLNGTVRAQEIDYLYDVRNRLTKLNSQLLQYDLFYDNNLPPAYDGQQVISSQNYNGNINAVQINYGFGATNNNPSNFDLPTIYGYQYDRLNRLKAADAIVGDFVDDATPSQVQSSYLIGDESYSYDRIGNIKTLQRHFKSVQANVMAQLEGYTYIYGVGYNRLLSAQGIPGTATRNYGYDANGNVTLDVLKGMTVTQYGRAAYPFELTKETENISYLYDVNDLRIYKNSTENGISKAEYYLKDALNRDVAVYNISNSSWTYHVHGSKLLARINKINSNAAVNMREGTFYLYDHLGNTRVTYTPESAYISSELDENNQPVNVSRTINKIIYAGDYFPYGKILREYSEGAVEKYLTTFHERDEETGLDYRGARYYDSEIAKFLSTDPLQAKYPDWSTYNYVLENPIMFIDPNGKEATDWFLNKQNGKLIYIKGESEVTQAKLDQIGSKYKISDYERLGDDYMFGDAPLILGQDGKNILDKEFEVVNASQSEVLMEFAGYTKGKRMTIQETEYVSGGRMGNENFSSNTTKMKQIGSASYTYIKSDQAKKIFNQFENAKESTDQGRYSNITTVRYKTIIPASRNLPLHSYFEERNRGKDLGKALSLLGSILDNFY